MTDDRANPPAAASARRAGPPSRRLIIIGAIVLAILAGLLVWLLTRGDDDDKTVSAPIGRPVAMTEDQLREFAGAQAMPVYWAGPRAGTTYELTRSAGGQIFIRYLPQDVRVGDARPQFPAVGTYPQNNAYAALTAAGRRKGYKAVTTSSGALIVYNRRRHQSVYFTFPQATFQVETFDPRTGRALASVLGGRIVQLR